MGGFQCLGGSSRIHVISQPENPCVIVGHLGGHSSYAKPMFCNILRDINIQTAVNPTMSILSYRSFNSSKTQELAELQKCESGLC